MAAAKLTITLDRDKLAEIHSLVKNGAASSVSGFVQRAVDTALLDAAGWRDLLAEALSTTGGPLTKRERAWADTILDSPRNRPRRKAA